jgi:hypothetical protein
MQGYGMMLGMSFASFTKAMGLLLFYVTALAKCRCNSKILHKERSKEFAKRFFESAFLSVKFVGVMYSVLFLNRITMAL